MKRHSNVLSVLAATLILFIGARVHAAAVSYTMDASHTAVVFKVMHMGMSHTFGRFNDVKGRFTLDSSDVSKSSFEVAINPDTIDTNNAKRDEHLKSPDFLNVKQHRTIAFRSTRVAAIDGGYEVTGDLTLHGVTKPITLNVMQLGEGQNRQGKKMVGMETEFTIKRTDYGMDKMVGPVGDEITLVASFEGIAN